MTVAIKIAPRKWRICSTEADSLNVPGVRKAPAGSEGSIDAIAAACVQLGIAPPPSSSPGGVPISIEIPYADTLRSYQMLGVSRLQTLLRQYGFAILGDEMGLGKTRQAAVVASILGTKRLIVCPAKVRESWKAELERLGFQDWVSFEPGGESVGRHYDVGAATTWAITSYEMLGKAIKIFGPDMCIYDEAHNLGEKKHKSKRSDVSSTASRLVKYALAVTGTPLWSQPADAYGLINLLTDAKKIFGHKNPFLKYYAGMVDGPHGGLAVPEYVSSEAELLLQKRHEELKLRLGYYMVRRLKKEVAAELPRLTRQIRILSASPEATKALQDAKLHRKAGDTMFALRATLKAKMPFVCEMAAEAKRFLILTYMKEHAYEIQKMLQMKYDTSCLAITGDHSTKQRAELVAGAAKSQCGVVATIDSVGEGLDGLQHVASLGIMHALHYLPNKLLQGEARIDRMGQPDPVTWVYPIIKDSADELVLEAVIRKLESSSRVVDDASALGLAADLKPNVDEDAALAALYDSLPDGEEDN